MDDYIDDYKTDPEYKKKCDELHAEALRKGELFYNDPVTKMRVATSTALQKKGQCCDKGCRHCPYPKIKK